MLYFVISTKSKAIVGAGLETLQRPRLKDPFAMIINTQKILKKLLKLLPESILLKAESKFPSIPFDLIHMVYAAHICPPQLLSWELEVFLVFYGRNMQRSHVLLLKLQGEFITAYLRYVCVLMR